MSERVTVDEAAKILGMSKQGVREHMKRNLFAMPIGEVTQVSKGRYQYHIYRSLLDRHVGKENTKIISGGETCQTKDLKPLQSMQSGAG